MTHFAIDFNGHRNLLAQEIPSAVGMVGLYIPGLVEGETSASAEYDFERWRFEGMVRQGIVRPCSLLRWPR